MNGADIPLGSTPSTPPSSSAAPAPPPPSRSPAPLAPRRAYQVALRRAVLSVGGMSTGSHAQRRTSAVEEKNARYRDHLKDGKTTQEAHKLAVQDTVEHLGHSRARKDLAAAYLKV